MKSNHPQERLAKSVGLSVMDLAIKLNISDRTLYRYFRNDYKNMDALKKKCICLCIDQAIKHRAYVNNKSVNRK